MDPATAPQPTRIMKPKKITLLRFTRIALGFAAFLPACSAFANDSESDSDGTGDVRVDVVVDLTDAGKKIVRPAPDHPAYYVPFPMGYKEDGAVVVNFQKKPPSAVEVQAMMGRVLEQQGYRIMTKQDHPTLVLYYWWGYVAPQIVKWGNRQSQEEAAGAPESGGYVSMGQGDSFTNEAEMLSIVAGETMDDKFDTTDLQKMELVRAAQSARWYVLVSAFDFNSWLKNLKEVKKGEKAVDQPVLLWRAHISTELWGHYLDQVLPTLIATAGPMLGRETKRPELIRVPIIPNGRVILGQPEVTNFPGSAAAPKQ